LKRMVARDGIEPPTPAFSGAAYRIAKWFEINGISLRVRTYDASQLGWLRTI